jgi:dolichol-phosphate mannosyltransferase
MRYAVDQRLPRDTGDYRLVSRECLSALQRMREQHRFLRGMVAWAGFPQTAVFFVRQPRAAGETKYPLSKMLRFAWIAATSFSPTPLRLVFGMSMIVAALGAAAGIYSLGARVLGYYVASGWTSLMIMQSVIGCFVLIALGVIGEYVAKIYEESKDRPLYLLDPARCYRRQSKVGLAAHAGGREDRSAG